MPTNNERNSSKVTLVAVARARPWHLFEMTSANCVRVLSCLTYPICIYAVDRTYVNHTFMLRPEQGRGTCVQWRRSKTSGCRQGLIEPLRQMAVLEMRLRLRCSGGDGRGGWWWRGLWSLVAASRVRGQSAGTWLGWSASLNRGPEHLSNAAVWSTCAVTSWLPRLAMFPRVLRLSQWNCAISLFSPE